MMKFLRDNSKKLMAIFGVILMIAFILPAGFQGGRGPVRHPVGKFGDETIYDTDLARGKAYWELLAEHVYISPERTGGQALPLIRVLTDRQMGNPLFARLAQLVAQHPNAYYLLQKEADRLGIVVTDRDVERAFDGNGWAIRLPSNQIVPLEHVGDLQWLAPVKESVAAFMKVIAALERAQDVVKVSAPMREQALATLGQQIQVRNVAFAAKDFLDKVPAPTEEQLNEHFQRYARFLPRSPSTADNPNGLGYKYPNRVTLQYIAVPEAEVRRAVRATRSDYDWEVEAQKYYLRNQNRFRSDPPTTIPTTAPAQPSTAPTTRPFADVREEVLESIWRPEIQRKAREVQDLINAKLLVGWNEYVAAHPDQKRATTLPTTSPSTLPLAATTQPGGGALPAYASYEYLQRIAADVQKQTGVLPTVASVGEFKSAEQLAELPGINAAYLNALQFGQYATELPAAVQQPGAGTDAVALQLLQPSQVLRDLVGSTYVFRLTGVRPSAPPESLAEVREQVERDWRSARAYELARDAARQLVNSATSDRRSLEAAAQAAGLTSTVTDYFGKNPLGSEIANLGLPPGGENVFRNESFRLLTVAASQPSAAITVIELPVQLQVLASELVSVRPQWQNDIADLRDASVDRELASMYQQQIRERWFDYDAIVARTGWTDTTGRSSEPATADGGARASGE